MDSLYHDNQADEIEAFNSTSRYLDDALNIDNPYCEGMVIQIYPSELQLDKAYISDTEAPFFDLHLSVANGFVSSKLYDKRDDFDFDIVNFPFLDGDLPRRASYGVYISLLREGLSEPEFYGDLVYIFKKLTRSNDFSFQLRKIITSYRRISYNLNVMRQSACFVFTQSWLITMLPFNCTPVGRGSDSMMALT